MYIIHSPERIGIKGYKGNDCTVNALGNALGISYDLSKKVFQTGIVTATGFTFRLNNPRTKAEFIEKRHVKKICKAVSISRENHVRDFGANIKKSTMSFERFAKENPSGTYLILSNNHLATVINGKLIDGWDSNRKMVEISYGINIARARRVIKELAIYYKYNSEEHFVKNHVKKILKKEKETKQ